MSTIAFIGCDGAGKSTVTNMLLTKLPFRTKYLYMGMSTRSSNIALPTSHISRFFKEYFYKKSQRKKHAHKPVDIEQMYEANRGRDRRGKLGATARLLNRLAEEWFRQFVSWSYQLRGYVVLYDRHFIFDFAPNAQKYKNNNRFSERLHRWLLQNLYIQPDMVIFLDAPARLLFERKGEATLAYLEAKRNAYLKQGERTSNFIRIDATQPLDRVLSEVGECIERFHYSIKQARSSAPNEGSRHQMMRNRESTTKKPAAVIVGLDSMQGLQAARILTAKGIPVIALAKDREHSNCLTNVCQQIHFADTDEQIIATLTEIGRVSDLKPVLFPCEDSSVLLVSRNRDLLARSYHISLPKPDLVEMLMDKIRFYTFAQIEGLPIPETFILGSRADAEHASRCLDFPCLLKPSFRSPEWIRQTTLKAFKIGSPGELLSIYDRYHPWTDRLIAQEWIEGTDADLYSCNCYFNSNSVPVVTFTARKIRQWPPRTGQSSLGIECRDDNVVRETLRLFRKVNYRGLGYVELKRDPLTGRYVIIEPNIGRPTGRSAIAEAGGVELLYTMYCDCLSMPLPDNRQQKYLGIKWVHLRRDFQSAFYYWRQGELTLDDWWRSLSGKKTYALFSLKDPRPFLADLLRGLRLSLSISERKKRDFSAQVVKANPREPRRSSKAEAARCTVLEQ